MCTRIPFMLNYSRYIFSPERRKDFSVFYGLLLITIAET
nr:MAG TPA: hypothetical protein [Caudoviricetes sp.]DAZ14509.1 MAG TPA: hypothetical protein [Caudoviricetes sp.]